MYPTPEKLTLKQKYLGEGGPVEKKLEKYREYIDSTATAKLSV